MNQSLTNSCKIKAEEIPNKELGPLYGNVEQIRPSTKEELVAWLNKLASHIKTGTVHSLEDNHFVARYTWTGDTTKPGISAIAGKEVII